jgi:hypothetical protein
MHRSKQHSYSITSSARSKIDVGTATPDECAQSRSWSLLFWRLMARKNPNEPWRR